MIIRPRSTIVLKTSWFFQPKEKMISENVPTNMTNKLTEEAKNKLDKLCESQKVIAPGRFFNISGSIIFQTALFFNKENNENNKNHKIAKTLNDHIANEQVKENSI